MARGDVVFSPEGERIELVDIGHEVLLDNDTVRVWEIRLAPGEVQPWHLHHNPYLVLTLRASSGRMDWLDGSPPRFLDTGVGGAVYRQMTPVHRLTNIGDAPYRNRLVEFKDLGEKRAHPVDIGAGARGVPGERPPGGPEPDGRERVLDHPHIGVWDFVVPAAGSVSLKSVPSGPRPAPRPGSASSSSARSTWAVDGLPRARFNDSPRAASSAC